MGSEIRTGMREANPSPAAQWQTETFIGSPSAMTERGLQEQVAFRFKWLSSTRSTALYPNCG